MSEAEISAQSGVISGEISVSPGEIAPDSQIARRLQALSGAILAISSELDLDAVLQRIADNAREFAESRYAALGLVNEQGIITSFITSGISKEEREKIGDLPRGHGLLGEIIKRGQILRVKDMSKDPRRSGFPPNHPPMTSLLGMPVSWQGRVIGDLYLTDKIGVDEFSAEDEAWVTLLARQAAVAVENASLYHKAQVSRQRTQTLAELAGGLNQSTTPEELFSQITQATCRLLELPAAALYLLDSTRTRFDLQAQLGLKANGESSLPLLGSIAGQVLEQGACVNIANTSQLSQTFFLPLESGAYPGALLVVPIKQNNRVSGVIEAYAAGVNNFSSEEIFLLEAFAGYAALALEKARLYQQKEDFLSMTAHDLRAPLTAIKMSAGLLEANLPPNLPPALHQLAANISRNSERLTNLLDDLLDLTRLEQGRVRLKKERLELSEIIAATSHTLTPLFEQKQQKLRLRRPDKAYWACLDRLRFEQALVNLLTNANKYSPSNGVIELNLQILGNEALIQVKDSGPGIPSEEQSRIFDRYYRRAMHEQTIENSGSGLGLPIARHLIELHGGELGVESIVGQGSSFFIKLPLDLS